MISMNFKIIFRPILSSERAYVYIPRQFTINSSTVVYGAADEKKNCLIIIAS